MRLRDILRRGDLVFMGSALLLSALSLLLLATGSPERLANPFLLRQSVSLTIAIGVFLLVSRTHYSFLRSVIPFLYVLLIVLLLIVLQQQAIRGAASWLVVGTLRLQPSELAKVILAIVLAKVFSERRAPRLDLRTLLLSVVYAGIPIGLVLIQPDFGTASLLFFLWAGMVACAGLTRRHALVLAGCAVIVAVIGWSFVLKDYQRDRLQTFLRPNADPLGSGYTVIQSMTSLGSGGLFGRGLGYGPQSRLNFLPEHRTDFIFARIGEELGFVGVAGVLTLYGVILLRMLRAAEQTSDTFGRFLAVGAFFVLLVGLLVNAGMNLGVLPVTGVPLPLVSYGGSSLVAMCILLGAVQSIRMHGETWESAEEGEDAGNVPLPIFPERAQRRRSIDSHERISYRGG